LSSARNEALPPPGLRKASAAAARKKNRHFET
jgi:hypothetical protein